MAATTLSTRPLGRTGLEVTVLGFGTKDLRPPTSSGGFGAINEPEQAEAILHAVLDAGINYIDTSIDYGPSEGIIGRFLGRRRDEFFLATKCGCTVAGGAETETLPEAHDFSPANLTAGIEQSLRRLRTDHLDVVQFHHAPSPSRLAAEGALEALERLRAAGKVRFVGASATLPEAAELASSGLLDVLQVPYSALQPEHEEVMTAAARVGAGVVVRGGVAQGRPPEGRGSPARWALFDRARLGELADGASDVEFLLRYTISHPDLATTIVATTRSEQLAANVAAAAKGPLPADVYAEARARLGSTSGDTLLTR